MTNIVIADHHALCREALCSYLRNADAGFNVKTVQDYQSLCSLDLAQAALVLIDARLPGIPGDFSGEDLAPARLALMIGYDGAGGEFPDAAGRFPKSLSCKAILSGIDEMLAGRQFHAWSEEPSIAAAAFTVRRRPQDFNLTAREKEVLSHLLRGASNKDIARSLDLQVVTVKLHVRGICRKLSAANRTQAALIAKENGWE